MATPEWRPGGQVEQPARRDQRQKPMRFVDSKTIGDELAFLTYQLV